MPMRVSVTAMMEMPMLKMERSVRTSPRKKAALVMSEPALPPAPTIPETTPSAGRETDGTMPNVMPSAIWTAMEKRNMMMMTTASVPEFEIQSSPSPSGEVGSESTKLESPASRGSSVGSFRTASVISNSLDPQCSMVSTHSVQLKGTQSPSTFVKPVSWAAPSAKVGASYLRVTAPIARQRQPSSVWKIHSPQIRPRMP
mmetsp:Transcript_29517/g.63539  ORF Transcript_29517/g.63539 Transcript_29517/m.63539 type:complete len:200 (+) Transcript_29517:458-1057(+)